jgi:NAD(P)H dehydrogenase (quinone)
MSKIAIPYYSRSGHTQRLAEAVLEGAHRVASESTLIDVCNITDDQWKLLQDADGIIFGSPTFMGGVAGEYKLFMDESAYRGFWTGGVLVDKMAAGFTVATYPSGDKLSTLIQLAVFAAQYGMIWVNNSGVGSKVSKSALDANTWGSWLGLMATSVPDKSKLVSDTDISSAKKFGERFARAVKRWN